MTLRFAETPYVLTTNWKFAGDQVTVGHNVKVGFGSTERPAQVGRLA
jgi:hypothetical protein